MSKFPKIHLALVILAIVIFLLAFLSPVSYTASDPTFSLLTSQAIVEHGSVKLDDYWAGLRPAPTTNDGRLRTINDHTYYYFPVGTSLVAVPFVWVANWFDLDMANVEEDAWLQNLISALISAALFFIIYRIAIYYLRAPESALLSAIFVLGTALISTIGTALWNLGFETLFIVLGLWLLVRLDHDSAGRTDPYILGLLLFAAFLSRPTAVIFIIVTLIFIGIRHRVYFLKTAATALLLLVLFILFSKAEYGTWLPPYYLPGRLGTGDTPFLITVYGLLFSPSRGIFIFSPIFLAAIALFIILAYQKRSRLPLLLWFAAIWFLAAVLSVSRFGHWWGGQSFGPRLLTDVVPALILLTIVTWYELRPKLSAKTARWIIALFLLLAIASITINTYAGLFNLQTIRWNGGMLPPDIDHAPQYLFSWRYPQFLANEELICSRNKDYFETSLLTQHIALASYQLGHVVTSHEAQDTMRIPPAPNWFLSAKWDGQERFESKHIVAANQVFLPAVLRRWPVAAAFVGAAYQNGETIEMRCNPASIVIGAAELVGSDQALVLKVQMGAFTAHDIHVSLNGTAPEVLTVDRQSMVAELPVNPLLLLPDKPNWITFTVPDQQSSALEIDRTSWPSIKSISIEAVD